MAISLSKGQTISLEKTSGLDRIHFGLGWDPAKKEGGGFLSRLFGGGGGNDEIDLDASCLLFAADKSVIDTVWFRQLVGGNGAVTHTGDNLTGAGDGDDEVIKVVTSRLPAEVAHLVFTVNSFRGQTFDEVDNAFCRVVDDRNDTELCRFTLAEKGQHTGVIMGVLSKTGGHWSFRAIGVPQSGRTVQDMAGAAARYL